MLGANAIELAKQYGLYAVGLVSCLAAESMVISQTSLIGPNGSHLISPSALAVSLLALFSLLYACTGKALKRIDTHPWVAFFAIACGLSGIALQFCSDALLLVAGITLYLFFSTTLLIAWLERLASIPHLANRHLLFVTCVCISLSQTIPVESEVARWLAAVLALASTLLYRFAKSKHPPAEESLPVSFDVNVSAKATIGLLLIGFTVGCTQSIVMQIGNVHATIFSFFSAIVGIASLGVLLFVVSDTDYSLAAKVVLSFMSLGVCLLVANIGLADLAYFFVSVSYTILWYTTYLIALEIARSLPNARLAIFGIVGFMLNAGSLIDMALRALGIDTSSMCFVALLALVLAFVSIWVFNDRLFSQLVRNDPADQAAQSALFEKNCQSISAHYGLTRRETEIMSLFALGRSAPFIAEQLFISENTVKTHLSHIYAKCGIHSRQELISLLRN